MHRLWIMVDIRTGLQQDEQHRLASGVAPGTMPASRQPCLSLLTSRHLQTSQQLDIARETADRRLRDAGALVGDDKLRPQRFELCKGSDFVRRLTGAGSGLRLRLCRDHQFSY
jgi:hypothetical protein